MSNTFYLQDTDFSIKLNIDGESFSLSFPETRLTIQVANLTEFLYKNNHLIDKLLDCIMEGLEYLSSQGYSLPLHQGMNDLLDVIVDQRTQKVDWKFQDYVPPHAQSIATDLAILYFESLN